MIVDRTMLLLIGCDGLPDGSRHHLLDGKPLSAGYYANLAEQNTREDRTEPLLLALLAGISPFVLNILSANGWLNWRGTDGGMHTRQSAYKVVKFPFIHGLPAFNCLQQFLGEGLVIPCAVAVRSIFDDVYIL